MNARGSGGRGRRPDKENPRSEPKSDTERLKNDMKSDGPRDRGKSLDKSPPRGRFDSRRDSKIPGKLRDRDGKQVFKRKDPGRSQSFKGGKYEIAPRSHNLDHAHYRDRDAYRERENYRSSSHDHGMKPDGKSFCDDTRLSKLVRRVQREDERDRKIAALRQLKEFFDQTENSKVVCQAASALMGVFMAIFKEGRCSRELRQEAASCLAILGIRLNEDSQKYVQWVFSELSAAQNEEIKVLLLSSLLQALKEEDGKGSLTNLVQMILNSCQNVLEDADVPELLMAVVDVILYITITCPEAFASHFTDTVDILVGWHIDATQGPAICQYTSDALVTFHEFWVADMNFSLTLLGQFLEDMEAYTEDLVLGLSGQNVTEEDMPLPEECVIKIASLFRVFNTVLKSLGEHYSPENESAISWEFVEDMIDRLVKCVDNSNRNRYSEEVLTEATRCFLLMVQGLQSDASKAQASLLPFVDEQFTPGPEPTETFISTFLELLHQVLVTMSTQLPVHFIQDFLATNSSTMQLRFHCSSQVVSQLLGVVEAVFAIKSVPIMEEAYRYIVGDLEVALNQLISPHSSAEPLHLIADNPHVETCYSSSQAETVCLFSICILTEIGNAKNNLIVMWALSPSVFELLARHLIPTTLDVLLRYPAVQYAFLRALHSHSTKHNNFISSSDLLSPSSGREGSILGNVNSATAGHLVVLIELISSLLKHAKLDGEIRVFSLKWSQELIEGLRDTPQIYTTSTFMVLIHAILELGGCINIDITVGVAKCLQVFMRLAGDCTKDVENRVLHLCSRKLSHVAPSVQESYQALIPLIKAPLALRESDLLVSSSSHPLHRGWQARRAYMLRTSSGTFHSHNFRAIMACLLHTGGHNLSEDPMWLQKMYSISQRTDKDKAAHSEYWNKNALQDVGLLWLWATWETAQFSILSKLRTPLGKPQDTFTTIEAGLRKYAVEIRNMETDQVKQLAADENKENTNDDFGSSLRASLLLQFMENLEKLLYNAYEGLANALPAPPKAARTFFRTNRGTCQEWLLRVRLHMVVMALHCGQPAMAYRHATELLKDMKESGKHQTPELENILMHAVTALVQLHCPEAILGLYAWAKAVTGTRHAWIKAAADMALGRYKNAANGFQSCLRSFLTPDPNLEDLSPDSPMPSPSSSPKFRPDGTPKLSILTKNTPIPPTPSAAPPPPNPALASHMVDQVCVNYVMLHQWEDVVAWQQTLQQYRSEHSDTPLQKAFYMNQDINYIKSLCDFELGDFPSVREHLELVPGGSLLEGALSEPPQLAVAWDTELVLQAAQKQLLRVVTQLQTAQDWREEMSTLKSGVTSCESLCENLLRMGSLCWPSKLDSPVMVLRQTAMALQRLLDGQDMRCGLFSGETIYGKLHPMDSQLSVALQAYDAACMLDTVQKVCRGEGTPAPIGSLRMLVSRLARKSNNLELSEKLLICQLSSHGSLDEGSTGLHGMLTSLSEAGVQQNHVKLLHIEREGAKLLFAQGEQHSAIEVLGAAVTNQLQTHTEVPASLDDAELTSRSLLTVTQWLQADSKLLAAVLGQLGGTEGQKNVTENGLARSIAVLVEMEKNPPVAHMDSEEVGGVHVVSNPVLPEADELAGRLLHLSTQHCPNLAKAWFSLASWGYKWGRKALDNASHGTVSLSTDEKAKVMSLLPQGTPSSEVEAVMGVLSQVHVGASNEEDITDTDQLLYDDDAETTRSALLGCCLSLQIASDACVERLLDVWREVVHRVYNYYQLAAKAYFTYLQLNTQDCVDLATADGHTTATLRLLRLLVKHAWELRDVLEDGLARTPTQPWKGIIPQLFSRLNHPEAYVRNSIAELLCRVARDSPHLIVYPAVVGCAAAPTRTKMEPQGGLLNDYLQEGEQDTELDPDDLIPPDDDLEGSEDPTQNMLQDCFKSITDSLATQNPSLISEVQALVSELRRVTLLWDELWLGTLNQHHADVTRRTTQLDSEIRRVVNNEDLTEEEKDIIITEKHKTILKPTLYAMERLHAITGRTIDTPHELWFHETYGALLEAAMEKLRHPTNPRNPHSSWSGFKQIHRNLQDRSAKRSSLWLSLERISPRLASLKDTQIAMPGVGSSSQLVTIQGLHDVLQILPTKTKPKKLIFIGSDGQKYSYLFKGLEDLHLDERIMQLIAIVNNMFAKTNRGDKELFRARHYSVTPLGSRSGLIQWVDRATPLFSLYKRWQQREALAQQIKLQQQTVASSSSSGSSSSQMPVIPRPSEIFYGKLTPALKEKSITNLENRKEWPLSVLRQVLQSIMAETPADLLAKELWCSSSSADEWWQVTQTYTRSTAVMSMIGYIIGLGDRHLDNVLVDLATGEVVHIDYNVCFEKGKGLRVPEKVPFRITQNIEGALGLTGVEGLFRLSCEHVLKTLRKGRETLLTLLEAFVYDPLVDWTTGNEAGYTGAFYGGVQAWAGGDGGVLHSKRDMEREITQSMLSIRVAEMKTAWTKNKSAMLEALEPLESCVEVLVACQAKDVETLNQRDQLKDLQSHLEEALIDPEHALYQLAPRYEEHSLVMTSRQEAEAALLEKLQSVQHWHEAHKGAVRSLQSGRLQTLFADASHPIGPATATFAPIREFLEGAGQGQTAIQCEQVDRELSTSLLQLRTLIHSCLDALHTYSSIIAQFPSSYLTETHSSRWTTWLQALAQELSKVKCQWVLEQYHSTYITGQATTDPSSLGEMEAKLQGQIRDCQARVTKLSQRRAIEALDTSVLALKAQEAASHTTKFMQDEQESGVVCVTGVVISHLCGMAKRYLIMEAAAAAAREQLVDLTSRDGDWFLDELCSMVGNMTHLLGQLPDRGGILSEDRCDQVSEVMAATRGVFEALQDLQTNFMTIILPESIKTLSQREPSVLAALLALEHIMVGAQRPMAELLRQLEAELLEAIMGMQSGPSETLLLVRGMQSQFCALLHAAEGPNMSSSLTPGEMLLMGFHGLFTRLEGDLATLLEAHAALAPPESWRKLDVVAEARSMQLSAFTPCTSGILSAIFFLQELLAITSFFQMCRTTIEMVNGISIGVIYDEEQMTKPIKKFIADFVRKQLIGLPGQVLGHVICLYIEALGINVAAEVALRDVGAASKVSVEELCQKAVEGSLLRGRFTTTHLSQATTLLGQTDAAWRKSDLASRLDMWLATVRGRLQRAQLQLTRYQWLHEAVVLAAGRMPAQMTSPTRSAIMAEINKGVQSLAGHEAMVKEVQQRHLALETSTTQRLKWAAGANPTLAATLRHFEAALEAKNTLIQNECTVSAEVQSLCGTIVHLESTRQRSVNTGAEDEACLQLITRCEETCEMLKDCGSTISSLEENMVNLKPLQAGETVDASWLQAVMEASQQLIVSLEEAMADAETDAQQAQEAVKRQVTNIRGLLTSHHKLMLDVRNILKTMAKQEEQEYGAVVNADGVRAYMATYKSFSESLTGMLQLVLAGNLAPQVAANVHDGMAQLRHQIQVIYDGLVAFAPRLLESGQDDQKGSVAAAAMQSGGGEAELAASGLVPGSPRRRAALSISSSPPAASASSSATRGTGNKKSDKVARDPRTGKAIQERNSYAVGVWRRVKLKLDGRDPDPSKRFSVAEQVDYVIQEATNLDNLAVLYEGWTPWV